MKNRSITINILFLYFFFQTNIILGQNSCLDWVNTAGGTGDEFARAVEASASGYVYVASDFMDTVYLENNSGQSMFLSNGDRDVLVHKYDTSGLLIWTKVIGGTDADIVFDMKIDADENIYMIGNFQGTVDFDPNSGSNNLTSQGNQDIYVLKLDKDGNFLWANSFGGPNFDRGEGIAVDPNQNVYITGSFEGTVDFDPSPATFNLTSNGSNDLFVQKLHPNGDLDWAFNLGGSSYDFGITLAVDNNNDILLGGGFYTSFDADPSSGTTTLTANGQEDYFIEKLDSSGNFIWAFSAGGTEIDGVKDITIDNANNIYVAGFFHQTVDFDPSTTVDNRTSNGSLDLFIQKLDANGNLLWVNTHGGTNQDYVDDLFITSAGKLVAAGSFRDTVDFDNSTNNTNTISLGFFDAYVMQLDTNGNFEWIKANGGPDWDSHKSLTIDPNGNIYTVGYLKDTVDVDPCLDTTIVISKGGFDTYIQKILPINCTTSLSNIYNTPQIPTITLFPNPVERDFVFDAETTEEFEVVVYDLMGRVQLKQVASAYQKINIEQLIPGNYIVHFKSEAVHFCKKITKL